MQHELGRDLRGVRVLVQGLGAVGGLLAAAPGRGGAEVLVSDIDPSASRRPVRAVDPAERDRHRVRRLRAVRDRRDDQRGDRRGLRCRVVAGAANNQLADAGELADRLHERGILYAPDYVINSGGVLHGTGLELLGWDQAQLDEALRGLGDTLLDLYADDSRSPVHAAEALVARRRAAV